MATFAVSITKELTWRGSKHRVSNVYHYRTTTGQTFPDREVVDAIVAAEKPIYANTVSFVEGRTWGPTGQGAAANKMREVYQLTGNGTIVAGSNFYPEFAILVYWKLGRYGSRNRPQFLRKWHHAMTPHGLPTTGERTGSGTPAAIQTYEAAVRVLNPAGVVDDLELCNPDGNHIPVETGVLYPYLEHRQIGR